MMFEMLMRINLDCYMLLCLTLVLCYVGLDPWKTCSLCVCVWLESFRLSDCKMCVWYVRVHFLSL